MAELIQSYGDSELEFTSDSDVMYGVAKLDNSEDFVKVFVHNKAGRGEEGSKYGQFFLITSEGCFIETDNGIEECTTHDAFELVSTRPQYHWDLYGNWILQAIAAYADGKDVNLTTLPEFILKDV